MLLSMLHVHMLGATESSGHTRWGLTLLRHPLTQCALLLLQWQAHLIQGFELADDLHRPKDLLLADLHAVLDISKDCRLNEVPLVILATATTPGRRAVNTNNLCRKCVTCNASLLKCQGACCFEEILLRAAYTQQEYGEVAVILQQLGWGQA